MATNRIWTIKERGWIAALEEREVEGELVVREWLATCSPEVRRLIKAYRVSRSLKATYATWSPEQRMKVNEHLSTAQKEWEATRTIEDKKRTSRNLSKGLRERHANTSPEEKAVTNRRISKTVTERYKNREPAAEIERGKNISKGLQSRSPEAKAETKRKQRERWTPELVEQMLFASDITRLKTCRKGSSWERFVKKELERVGEEVIHHPKPLRTPEGIYAPDLYLPKHNVYIEIKHAYFETVRQKSRIVWLNENGYIILYLVDEAIDIWLTRVRKANHFVR